MSKEDAKISALVITYNEEENIEGILDNLSFADELIVIDSYSTDRTVALIEEHPNVKLIQRKFINYTDQKSYALTQASHDWVLFLDADERLTPELKAEVLEVIHSDESDVAAYFFKRKSAKNPL